MKVCGVADLLFNFLFAVPEIIVRDDRHDNAALVASGDFESAAVVVTFVFVFPTHPVAPLAFGRVPPMRQSQGLLGRAYQMWRENDAPRVSGPMFNVEACVVFRKKGI